MTLTADERSELDSQGFVVLESVIDSGWLADLRKAFEAVVPVLGTGTRHADKLESRDPSFAAVLANDRVNAAAAHVLGRPFRLFHLSGRDPLSGFGQQGLHTDWTQRAPSDPYFVVTALWMLDDFTETNGATRVVPGSHRLPKPLPKSMQQPESRHAEQKTVIAKAGSVLVLNGHLWHSGTRNATRMSRRVLQCQFVADQR